MANTIGNPLSWGARLLGAAGHDIGEVVREIGGEHVAEPEIRHIGIDDIRIALRLGLADFVALRTDVIVVGLLYPVIGACLVWVTFHQNLLPLVFPLISGFALVGPAAAVGLYEMSRRREAGEPTSWTDGFAVLHSARFGAIMVLGLGLLAIYIVWMVLAYGIFLATMGPDVPASASVFVHDVLTTSPGWAMMAVGIPAGFVFAVLVLATSVVSFPLLLDRHVGLPKAVVTSVRAARQNPLIVGLWGAIVAALLAVGSIPFLLGLAVVLPVLGHATWHLYRRMVAPA
jgi:uncharacterized membrane protein